MLFDVERALANGKVERIMIFEQEFKMTLEDIDKSAYITNKAILRFFENTATYHSDSVGGGINGVETTGRTWIVLDWRVKVLNRIKYGETITVRTWSRGIYKFFAFRDYELLNSNKEVCAIGTSRWILRDINKGKMTLLNESLMKEYQSEDRTVFPDEGFDRILEPNGYSNDIEYIAMRRDIDFNGHMHNLYHFDLAYDALPQDVYENSIFDNFRISYKKEVKLRDRLVCRYFFENGKNTVVISNSNGDINSIIQLW